MEQYIDEEVWYINRVGSKQAQGPFSLLVVIDMYRNRHIDSETLVSSPKYKSWTPISSVSEVTEEVGFIPPPAPNKIQPKDPIKTELASYEQPKLGYPASIEGFHWNWGGFLLPLFWGLSHRKYWVLLMLIPYIGLLFNIWYSIDFGVNGHKIAWNSGRFSSETEHIACQRIWLYWSVAVNISILLLFAFAAIAEISSIGY